MGTTTELGSLIRQLRDEKGLSQDALGEKVGRSQRWVSSVEGGEIVRPRQETLRRLAGALGVPVSDLVIASNLAHTRAEAERVDQSIPEEDSPVWDIVMAGARDLNEEGIELLADMITTLKKKYSKSGS